MVRAGRAVHASERRATDPRDRLLAELPLVERRVELGGISTAVLEGGDGPPMVLLHGPGTFAGKWLRVAQDLMASHHVVAPDLPGHGATDLAEDGLSVDVVLRWLDQLIEHTCDAPPTLIGQISGGAIAARFAAHAGQRVARLVLVDTLGLAPFQPDPGFRDTLTRFMAQPSGENHDRFWEYCAHDLSALRGNMGERWELFRSYNLDRAGTPSVRAAVQQLLEEFGFAPIPPEILERIAVPVSLIWGRHDLATPLRVAREASVRYGWPLYVVEGAADDPPLEQPEGFMAALRQAEGLKQEH